MDPHLSALQRAFQLARPGQFSNVDDMRKRLKQEGYDANAVFVGKSLKAQVTAVARLETNDAAKR
jgi:hypothetical protein